ncbi:hypothetical protein FRC00_002375 [Tulasnella sp. 408]|nr:hypothetical protein FRC00_002375 [Tulasnella sp. 408]
MIAEGESSAGKFVARRFVKSASRKAEGTRALLKLSDDELDKFGYEAINPISTSMASRKLLTVVLKHSDKSSFFEQAVLPLLRDGTEGPAAILYLAMAEPRSFFARIKDRTVFDFCSRVISTQEAARPKWYCAVKLLCLLLQSSRRDESRYQTKLQSLLFAILQSFIHLVTEERQTEVHPNSEYQFVFRGLPVLPLLAACCERLEDNQELDDLARSTPLKSFLEFLIRFVFPEDPPPRRLNAEEGLGVYTLISFLKVPSVAKLFVNVELSRFARFLVDMVLKPWALNFAFASTFEKKILMPLYTDTEMYITCLCSLPGSSFSGALSGALKEGMVQLDSPNAYPYAPLGLVERLLSLSNMEIMQEQIHRALVDGGACEFLAHALNHTGGLDAGDRGLWRAKGLAMTCLGNIVERMDKEQFCNRIKKEMIACVVAIKEGGEVPLVQKGQAIFLLQRYTLTVDRLEVQTFHREATESMTKDTRIAEGPRIGRGAREKLSRGFSGETGFRHSG